MVKRNLRLQVEGIDNLPSSGPVIIAARHYHHLYDGCALVATIPRPSHILVAGDWVGNPAGRYILLRACAAAGWPMVIRPGGPSGAGAGEAAAAFRKAASQSLEVLRDGHVLITFPEGYPNIDPGYTPKSESLDYLPFQRGVVRLANMAYQRGLAVPIIPVGLSYTQNDKWNIVLRFGEPELIGSRHNEVVVLRHLEQQVMYLSRGNLLESW